MQSGQVQFVADAGQRQEVPRERLDQTQHTRADTAKPTGQESGADFRLRETISSLVDERDSTDDLLPGGPGAADIASNVQLWQGQKKVKKLVERSKTTFVTRYPRSYWPGEPPAEGPTIRRCILREFRYNKPADSKISYVSAFSSCRQYTPGNAESITSVAQHRYSTAWLSSQQAMTWHMASGIYVRSAHDQISRPRHANTPGRS